jgi:cellobiose-specific phosphotransferase system component IIC
MRDAMPLLVAGSLVLLGIAAFALLAGERGTCLGPLGVTEVQCAQATRIVPRLGVGVPILVASLAASIFVLAPVSRDLRMRVAAAGILGGVIGGLVFLAFRPVTMDGWTSSGSWISITRPLDANALATAIVLGTFVGSYLYRSVRTRPSGR